MKAPTVKPVRCAIYTRVSTEHGLDQEFNSLNAQYDAASAYIIKSQAHAGWTLIRSRYDDGGYSGGSTDRPDLQKLLDDIRARKVDVIVVYKVADWCAWRFATPCILHRPFGIAGDWHADFLRVRTPRRGLRCIGNLLCMGLFCVPRRDAGLNQSAHRPALPFAGGGTAQPK